MCIRRGSNYRQHEIQEPGVKGRIRDTRMSGKGEVVREEQAERANGTAGD
jgi:hypothetical protein